MKVIFLDIDGVMVTANCKERSKKYRVPLFDPESVKRLKRIIDATGAEIVLSSTWRKFKDIHPIIEENGFRMIGRTPELDNAERGDEIKLWLSWDISEIDSFVILDDDDDMGELLPYLVQTSWWTGITDEHVKRAIEILNGEKVVG